MYWYFVVVENYSSWLWYEGRRSISDEKSKVSIGGGGIAVTSFTQFVCLETPHLATSLKPHCGR